MATPVNSQLEEYKKTFTAFGGADITATFDGTPIANLQAITYSIQREKVPLYRLGDANPIGFGRGKRGIAGSLIFNQFDREALMEVMLAKYAKDKAGYGFQSLTTNLNQTYQKYVSNRTKDAYNAALPFDPYHESIKKGELDSLGSTIQQINSDLAGAMIMPGSEDGDAARSLGIPLGISEQGLNTQAAPQYVDQLMPFNITILFLNEYGHRARMEILGAEILNEGISMSVDDVQLEKAMTFVCRRIQYIRPFDTMGKSTNTSRKLNFKGGF